MVQYSGKLFGKGWKWIFGLKQTSHAIYLYKWSHNKLFWSTNLLKWTLGIYDLQQRKYDHFWFGTQFLGHFTNQHCILSNIFSFLLWWKLLFWSQLHREMVQCLSITKYDQIQLYKYMLCDQAGHNFWDRLLTGQKHFLEIAEKHIMDQGCYSPFWIFLNPNIVWLQDLANFLVVRTCYLLKFLFNSKTRKIMGQKKSKNLTC